MIYKYMMTKNMEKSLDTFLVEKTCTDIDRSKYIPFVLRDGLHNLTTCLVFNCNSHAFEDPTIITIEYTGAVIHLPAYWVEIPKELAFTYICRLINDLYAETYAQWINDGFAGGAATDGDNSDLNPNCNCPCSPNGGFTKL